LTIGGLTILIYIITGFISDGGKVVAFIVLRITVRTFLNSQTLSLLTVPCSLFPVPLRVALYHFEVESQQPLDAEKRYTVQKKKLDLLL
jgi:hypothetical protein